MPVNPRHYWVSLYPPGQRWYGERWEQPTPHRCCSHGSHLVPTAKKRKWEWCNPSLYKVYRHMQWPGSHCPHHLSLLWRGAHEVDAAAPLG